MQFTSKNYYAAGLFILFAGIISSIYLTNFYKNNVAELNSKIFPTSDKGVFSVFSMQQPVENGGIGVATALKPGQSYKGTIGIKNYEKEKRRTFRIGLTQTEHKAEGYEDIVPSFVKFDMQDIVTEPEQVAIVPFTIDIPKDAKPGKYQGVIAAKNVDSDAKKSEQNGLILEVAQGVNVKVEVSENAQAYTYNDRSQQARDLAMKLTIERVRLIAGGVLVLLSLYFMFLHFSSKRKQHS